MRSMTGYGKAEYAEGGRKIAVELKSVNNRYLDLSCKYPRAFVCLEDAIRKAVQSKIGRGRVDLFVTCQDNREKETALAVDYGLAGGLVKAVRDIAERFYLTEDAQNMALAMMLKGNDVVKAEAAGENLEELAPVVTDLVLRACDKLNEMREIEGAKLAGDMLARLGEIERTVEEIAERAPKVAEEYREKLRAKVEEYVGGKVDENRLLAEVALFADKSNIDEELTRLRSHISQFRKIAAESGSGRKLDFLIQEFNREANTICSKASDVAVTDRALALKCEIEKIREQVQNVE